MLLYLANTSCYYIKINSLVSVKADRSSGELTSPTPHTRSLCDTFGIYCIMTTQQTDIDNSPQVEAPSHPLHKVQGTLSQDTCSVNDPGHYKSQNRH